MNTRILLIVALLSSLNVVDKKVSAEEDGAEQHSIRVQLMLVEADGNLETDKRRHMSGPVDQVIKAVNDLSASGVASIVNQAELSVLVETQAMLQIGETVPVRVGTQRTPMGGEQKIYKDVSIGTIIQVIAKVVDGDVVMDMDFEKSFVTPRGADDDPESPEGTSQMTHQSTLRIKDGHAQLVAGMMSRSSADQSRTVHLIVAADILDSASAGQVTKFQSFSRTSSQARRSTRPPNRNQPAFPTAGRVPPPEMRGRIAEAMFDRADKDEDGSISESELPGLVMRDKNLKPPITKMQYRKWFIDSKRPLPGTQPRPKRIDDRNRRKPVETDDAKSTEQDEIRNAQIQVIPNQRTIILRGSKSDVKRIAGVIKELDEDAEEEGDKKGDLKKEEVEIDNDDGAEPGDAERDDADREENED